MKKLHLGFLASGGGSNMQAIIDAIKSGRLSAEARAVISNNSQSGALERAKKEGIPFYHISGIKYPSQDELDSAIIEALESNGAELIVLAGYMKKIGPELLQRFEGRILNIHPALLPKFGGKGMYGINVHKAVLNAGEKQSGATVHIVDEKYDNGRILARATAPVLEGDTPETLAARVLKQEHLLYPETLQKIASGEITL